MTISNIIFSVFGFFGIFVGSFIVSGIPAVIFMRYKIGTAMILFMYSSSIGYAIAQTGGELKYLFIIAIVACWSGWITYKAYKAIIELKEEYGNTKMLKRAVNVASFFIHMALFQINLVLFNIEDYDSVSIGSWISACIFIAIASYVLDGFEDVMIEVTGRIVSEKIITKEKFIKEYSSKIRKYKIGFVDYDFEAFEILEVLGRSYTDIDFISDRNNKEVAICVFDKFYYSTVDYIENIVKTKQLVYVYEVLQGIQSQSNVVLDTNTLKNFVNLQCDTCYCFGDVIITKEKVEEIRRFIDADLKSGTFNVVKVQEKFNIGITAVTELAKYFGANVKIA